MLRACRESPLAPPREAYESCAAALRFDAGRLAQIRLLPVDLQFDAPDADRGRPRWADPALGRAIVERIADRSQRYGTKIEFDAERNEGRVALG